MVIGSVWILCEILKFLIKFGRPEKRLGKLGINMSVLNQKIVLVTGGAGFIGSCLVKRLINLGAKVLVLDLKSSFPSFVSSKKNLVFIQGDLCDLALAQDLIKNYKFDLIFHLAAQPIVEAAYFNPRETLENNIMSTINILEVARKAKADSKIKGIIITSSDKAYGKPLELPYREDHPLQGDHPYDVSKSSIDLISQAYFKTYNLPVIISRFSNVFGPGDLNFNRVMPGIFEAIIKNEEFLIRSDGEMKREYTYVGDIANSYIKLTENLDKCLGQAFNFGSKNIFKVLEVVKKIEEILKVKINYKLLNTAKNEIPEQYLDCAKAKKMLGWQPKTSFEQGIKESFNWYKKYLCA
jgi:CDP-glucose 4,6-dehydratase